jgi:hypothetical protein
LLPHLVLYVTRTTENRRRHCCGIQIDGGALAVCGAAAPEWFISHDEENRLRVRRLARPDERGERIETT